MSSVSASVKDTLSPALTRAASSVLTEARRLVSREGLRLQGKVQGYLKAKGIYDTGELRRSVNTRDYSGSDFVYTEVGSNTKYAEAVHEGRKAKMPPVEPLIEWVRRRVKQGRIDLEIKSGTRRGRGRKKGSKAKYTPREAKIRSIAWAIALHKAKHKTPGRPFFDEVHQVEEPGIRERIGQGLFIATRKAVTGE